jgi:probable F420-dependent oxidoreductase
MTALVLPCGSDPIHQVGQGKESNVQIGITLQRWLPAMEMFSRDSPQLARRAEELGFESCWISDHLIKPTVLPPIYPYSSDNRSTAESDTPMYDPWVALATVSAMTERIRLGTNVYVLPLRDPFVTARTVGTLDVLSGGRVVLGCGIGWMEPEFAIASQTFSNRGKRADEIIPVLRKLWSEENPEHHGNFYDFPPVKFEPKTVQQPSPPILVAGGAEAALRRAAALGDGWIATPTIAKDLDLLARTIGQIEQLRAEFDRSGQPFQIQTGSGGKLDRDHMRRLEDLGVTRATVSPWTKVESGADPLQQGLDDLERVAGQLF